MTVDAKNPPAAATIATTAQSKTTTPDPRTTPDQTTAADDLGPSIRDRDRSEHEALAEQRHH
jgi:hypothetical protein